MSFDLPDEPKTKCGDFHKPAQVHVSPFDKFPVGRRKYRSGHPIASLSGVYGITCHNDKVWAKLITGQSSENLEKMLDLSVGKTIPWSPLLDGYEGVITKRRFYYLAHVGKPEEWIPPSVPLSVWSVLKQKLAAKHGIRKKQLPLYMAECIWRINYENDNAVSQRKRILSLIQERYLEAKEPFPTL